jgi:hypothetical protein
MAERTGLEPATPGVTGRYSNQLNYRSAGCSFHRERAFYNKKYFLGSFLLMKLKKSCRLSVSSVAIAAYHPFESDFK